MPKTTCLLHCGLHASPFVLFQNKENEDVETDVTRNLSISGEGHVT